MFLLIPNVRTALTRPESAEVTRHERRTGQLGFPGLHNLLGLFGRDLFQDPFHALTRAGVLETFHDRRGGKVWGGESEEDSRDWKISIGRAERELKSRGLTSQSLLIPTQVLESRRPSVQSLDTEVTRHNHLISTSIPSTNNEKPFHRLLLGGIELERLVTVIEDLLVSRRRHVLPACGVNCTWR
jgi:hypothetical protein